MDNGDVVLFEATGYIVNHTVRTLPAPQFSAADAQAKLSKNLTPRGEGAPGADPGGKHPRGALL